MNVLDHIVLAVPDLDEAKIDFYHQTSVMPIDGGPHEGLGTRNALVSFGDGAYLEIIAPDPEQSLHGNRGAYFAQMPDAQLLHWAVRVSDLKRVSDHAKAGGLSPGNVIQMSRKQPNGKRLEWELMGIGGHELGGCAPFFIDWLKSPHPSDAAPRVGTLNLFQIDLPAESPLTQFLERKPQIVTIVNGSARMTVSFDSPNGAVSWTAENPAGFGI